jgi:hypothetical protein
VPSKAACSPETARTSSEKHRIYQLLFHDAEFQSKKTKEIEEAFIKSLIDAFKEHVVTYYRHIGSICNNLLISV